MTGFDPASTMEAVDRGANLLEKAADALHDAVAAYEKAEEGFDLEMAKLRLEADSASMDKDGKMPSQGRRHDLALVAMKEQHAETYADYFAAKATREAKQVKYRALAAAVSARQSLLKAMGP